MFISVYKILNYLFLFSIFFPFIGVFPGIDIQPNFIIITFLFYFTSALLFYKKSFSRIYVIILFFLLFIYTTRFVSDFEVLDYKSVFTYWAGLVTPFLIYNLIKMNNLFLKRKLIYTIISIYLFIALFQVMLGKDLFGFLVTRPSEQFTSVTSEYRGFRSLTPEPSNFGKIIIYLNILVIFIQLYPIFNPKKLYISFLLTFFLFILNTVFTQSFYSVFFHLIIISLFIIKFKRIYFFNFIIIIVLLFSIFYYSLPGSRFSTILSSLFDLDFNFIINQGAFARVTNILQSFYGGLFMLPFGFGNSNDIVIFISDIYSFGIGKRNLGGIIEHFLRFGFLSLPFFFLYFFALHKISNLKSWSYNGFLKIGTPFSLSLLILMMQDGSVADPLPWFIFFTLLYNTKKLQLIK